MPLIEQRCNFKVSIGLCHRTSFACQPVSDVALDMSPGWFAPSQSSNSTALFDCRISSGRSWRAVCNGSHARVRTRRIACALPARLLLCQTPLSPVHSINTHVSHIRNARAMRRSKYAVPLIHHVRPLNHQENRRFHPCSGAPLGGPTALPVLTWRFGAGGDDTGRSQ